MDPLPLNVPGTQLITPQQQQLGGFGPGEMVGNGLSTPALSDPSNPQFQQITQGGQQWDVSANAVAGTNGRAWTKITKTGLEPVDGAVQAAQGKDAFTSPTAQNNALTGASPTQNALGAGAPGGQDFVALLSSLGQSLIQIGTMIKEKGLGQGNAAPNGAAPVAQNLADPKNPAGAANALQGAGAPKADLGAPLPGGQNLQQIIDNLKKMIEQMIASFTAMGITPANNAAPVAKA